MHICVTDQRPDIVLYSDSLQTIILVDLTCRAEENIADARLRKSVKYTPLKQQIVDNGWNCHLWTIEVGARGLVAGSVRRCLQRLGFKNTVARSLIRNVSVCVSRCSFALYKSYRVQKWTWTSLVRIGVRPTQPSTLPDTRQIHTQVDSKRNLPLTKLSTPPSASRPQPPDNELKYGVLHTFGATNPSATS